MKICKCCDQEFEPKNNKAIYCGNICRQKDYRKSIAEKLSEFKNMKSLLPKVGYESNGFKVTEITQHNHSETITIEPKNNTVYNFENEQWLILEKYTKFPMSQKPKIPFEQSKWLNQKRESDMEIRIAWDEFKKHKNEK